MLLQQLLGDRMVEEAANFGSVPELSKSYEFNEAEAKPAQIASIQAGSDYLLIVLPALSFVSLI